MKKNRFFLLPLIAFLPLSIFPQQVADTSFKPSIERPEYKKGQGPTIMIDEGHHNYHTAEGRYFPFAQLLREDGYNVKGYSGRFEKGPLEETKILVIANALNRINIKNWYLPTPSAFTSDEIEEVRNWVKSGGSLFLIADHMPMGGAAAKLAAAFGFKFTNGFAADTSRPGSDFFYRKDGTLLPCSITNGRNNEEYIDKVVTFTGQAFRSPPGATVILRFDSRYLLLESDTAWVFGPDTRYTPIEGWSQGAYMRYGRGRLVMFGEAAMFSAQLAGPSQMKFGMNSDFAEENYKLLLNIIHWLDGKISD